MRKKKYVELGAVKKRVHLVDLEKCCKQVFNCKKIGFDVKPRTDLLEGGDAFTDLPEFEEPNKPRTPPSHPRTHPSRAEGTAKPNAPAGLLAAAGGQPGAVRRGAAAAQRRDGLRGRVGRHLLRRAGGGRHGWRRCRIALHAHLGSE